MGLQKYIVLNVQGNVQPFPVEIRRVVNLLKENAKARGIIISELSQYLSELFPTKHQELIDNLLQCDIFGILAEFCGSPEQDLAVRSCFFASMICEALVLNGKGHEWKKSHFVDELIHLVVKGDESIREKGFKVLSSMMRKDPSLIGQIESSEIVLNASTILSSDTTPIKEKIEIITLLKNLVRYGIQLPNESEIIKSATAIERLSGEEEEEEKKEDREQLIALCEAATLLIAAIKTRPPTPRLQTPPSPTPTSSIPQGWNTEVLSAPSLLRQPVPSDVSQAIGLLYQKGACLQTLTQLIEHGLPDSIAREALAASESLFEDDRVRPRGMNIQLQQAWNYTMEKAGMFMRHARTKGVVPSLVYSPPPPPSGSRTLSGTSIQFFYLTLSTNDAFTVLNNTIRKNSGPYETFVLNPPFTTGVFRISVRFPVNSSGCIGLVNSVVPIPASGKFISQVHCGVCYFPHSGRIDSASTPNVVPVDAAEKMSPATSKNIVTFELNLSEEQRTLHIYLAEDLEGVHTLQPYYFTGLPPSVCLAASFRKEGDCMEITQIEFNCISSVNSDDHPSPIDWSQ